jgi:succinate dehydrogenase/fumarate reductase cytochrome b subunit
MRFIKSPIEVVVNNEKHFVVKVNNDPNLQKLLNKMKAEIIVGKEFSIDYKNLSDVISKLKEDEIIVMTRQIGQAFLLVVRDTLKNPFMVGLYTIFVLASSFHALNGLWTFLISWGLILSYKSQQISLRICFWVMLFILSLGLISIWGSFFY